MRSLKKVQQNRLSQFHHILQQKIIIQSLKKGQVQVIKAFPKGKTSSYQTFKFKSYKFGLIIIDKIGIDIKEKRSTLYLYQWNSVNMGIDCQIIIILFIMQFKQNDNALLIHRPRKRRHFVIDPKQDQKSQNLKALHQTLLCENSQRRRYHPDRATAIQIPNSNNSRSLSRKSALDQSKEKERPVNFYINIEKLRNLKLSSSKQREHKRSESSQSYHNSYLKKDKLHNERKSELLKSYGIHKRGSNHSSSDDRLGFDSISRNRAESEANKGRVRYKTQTDEDPPIEQSNKKSIFKRAHNDSILKDKTFIDGYLRGKQLGRGGFSKVWQGFHFKTKTFYAIKQIDTTNKYQTHLTEIWFGNFFFDEGQPKKQFLCFPGIWNLLRMYTYSIMDPRAFIVYESCNGSLGNMLYDIYEEDRDDQINEDDKLYMIKYKPLYNQLRKSTAFLKSLVMQIAQALDLLAQHKIVHSDIKTENILLKVQEHQPYQFKLIDYGSSFVFENLKQYKLATPEYMCPELLNYILYENRKSHRTEMLEYVKHYENTSAIDVWGLGCIIVELIHGLPLWLSNKTKILVNGKYETKRGLFAVSDRSFAKILDRQLNVVDNFEAFLRKENNSGIALSQSLKEVLRRMLNPNPLERIRPHQIIAALAKEQC